MTETNDTAAPPPRRRLAWAVGGLALIALGSALVYGMTPAGKPGAAACPGGGAAAARLDPLVHGEVAALSLDNPPRLAPDLAFTGPEGKPMSLADFRGKTVLINLWATWCIPCRKEMPALDRLEAERGGPDFQVVAINVDTARLDRPKAFLKDAGIATLAFYADPTANVLQTLKAEGQLLGLPTTLLIDRHGCELGVMAGPAEWSSPEAETLIDAAKG